MLERGLKILIIVDLSLCHNESYAQNKSGTNQNETYSTNPDYIILRFYREGRFLCSAWRQLIRIKEDI